MRAWHHTSSLLLSAAERRITACEARLRLHSIWLILSICSIFIRCQTVRWRIRLLPCQPGWLPWQCCRQKAEHPLQSCHHDKPSSAWWSDLSGDYILPPAHCLAVASPDGILFAVLPDGQKANQPYVCSTEAATLQRTQNWLLRLHSKRHSQCKEQRHHYLSHIYIKYCYDLSELLTLQRYIIISNSQSYSQLLA